MWGIEKYAHRLLRKNWADIGTQNLFNLPDIATDPAGYSKQMEASVRGTALGLQQFVEELVTMLSDDPPMTVNNQVTYNQVPTGGGGSGGTAEILWAWTSAKWVNAAGNGSYVNATKVDAIDASGAGTDAVVIYLPRHGSSMDPNVRANRVIGYVLDQNSVAIALDSCLDDPIGSCKHWMGAEVDIPLGWQKLASSNGILLCGVGGASGTVNPYDTGGFADHNHSGVTGDETITISATGGTVDPASVGTGTVTFDPIPGRSIPVSAQTVFGSGSVPTSQDGAGSGTGSGSANTGTKVTGITIESHTNHNHHLTDPTFTTVQAGLGSSVISGYVRDTEREAPTLSHNDLITDPGHFHALSGITFSFTVNLHSHDVPIAGIAAGMGITPGIVTIPQFTPTGTFDPGAGTHTHGLTGLSFSSGGTHSHTITDDSSYPPVIGTFIIERFE